MNSSEDFEKICKIACLDEIAEKINLLRRISAFSGVPVDQLKILASLSKCKSFPKGMFLFHQGDYDPHCYIIKQGRIRLYRNYEDRSIMVGELGPDELFGALALFADIRRLRSAQAILDTSCLVIEQNAFRKFIINFPEVALRVLEIMVKRLAAMEDKFIDAFTRELRNGPVY